MFKYVSLRSHSLFSQSQLYIKSLRPLSSCQHTAHYSNGSDVDITNTTFKKEVTKIKTLWKKSPKPRPAVDPDFDVIYKYPGIEQIRSISRMKFYSFLSNGIMIPCFLLLEYFEHVEQNTSLVIAILGSTLTASFFLVGIVINRFVGMIYYNTKTDIVKIASLSYTGIRVDDHVPRSQLTTFKKAKWFPILSIFYDKGSDKQYKIISQNGVINPIVYNSIFCRDPAPEDSNPDLQTSSLPPPAEKDVNFDDIIKKAQTENEMAKEKSKG